MTAEADPVTVGAESLARPTVSTSYWMSPEQKDLMDRYRKTARLPQTTIIDDALREYFAARGIEWPHVLRRLV